MAGFYYFLIGWWLFGAALTTAMIGRKRDPYTPTVAVLTWIVALIFIVLLLSANGKI